MKKTVKILLCSFIGIAALPVLVSCGSLEPKVEDCNAYYKPEGYADVVYVIPKAKMTDAETVMISSLQGILAQEKSAIFISGMGEKNTTIQELQNKYNFQVRNVDDPWALLDTFKNRVVGKKYVTYETSMYDNSINRAATIAGVKDWIMAEKSIMTKLNLAGFSLGTDATALSDEDVFYTYKDSLNNSYIINQAPSKIMLRDYGIAGHALCTYVDFIDANFRAEISEWAKENATMIGWTENETDFVEFNSIFSIVTIAADWSGNLSFMATENVSGCLTQVNKKTEEIVAEKGKHYVTITMSDGDNIQWLQRGFETDSRWFGSAKRGQFKMNWTICPSAVDLIPNVVSDLYKEGTAKDCFIAGPSGFGYINPTIYNKNSLASYAKLTADYMKKSDLSIINMIDGETSKGGIDEFAKYSNIKGGLWSVGMRYIQSGTTAAGGVYWSNNKPFVTFREALWRASGDRDNKYYGYTERVAQRINDYCTDPTKIEGYTAVVCHAWSIGTMEYINRFISQLDDHVVVVSADEFIDMISKNVKHEDVGELNDLTISDYNDKDLCDIQTTPFYWKDIKDTKVATNRSWEFNETPDPDWNIACGGLEYDSATWTSEGIKLDGSDLSDREDYIPNAYAYTMLNFTNNDKLINVQVKGGINSDAFYRVRIVVEDPKGYKGSTSYTLDSPEYLPENKREYGYYLFSSEDYTNFTYDISGLNLNGKKGVLVIEQDDSGEGSGEIVIIKSVDISEGE